MDVNITIHKSGMHKPPGAKKEIMGHWITTESGSHENDWVSIYGLSDQIEMEQRIAKKAAAKNGGAS